MDKDNKGTYLILSLLLIIASVLRLIHPFEIPFYPDEISALARTKFNTFSDLISKGVLIDAHPAGVQVFLYYWTKAFGYSELAVKLPFIACGVLAVLYVFLLGREWFNSTTGLVCAAFIATLQYTIVYSQDARPYISGLFFALGMVLHWNKVVFKPGDKYYKNVLLYILFSALCAYNHHFSLLFAIIVGLTGLFFVKRKFLLKYVFAGISIFILYIPHLHIFFYQLKIGGIGGWLAKPDNDYIIQYIQYAFQFSTIVYVLVGLLFLTGLINRIRKGSIPNSYSFISLSWFLLPFLIGFFYSRYVNSVMEYSCLIFSFPFMLYSIFGWLPNLNTKAQLALVLVICFVNIFVLTKERRYYDVFYKSTYERQVIIDDSIYKKVGENNLIALIQSDSNFITRFYFRKHHTHVPYIWMPDSVGSTQRLVKYMEKNKTTYLTYNDIAGSNLLYLPVILNYYPCIVLQNKLEIGTNYIFSSLEQDGKSPYIFQSVNDFEKPCEYWGASDKSFLSDSVSSSGKYSYKMDSLHEWGPSFSCDLTNIAANRNVIILVSVSVYPLGSLKDVLIVLSLESHGKQIFWSASPVTDFIYDNKQARWVKAYNATDLSGIYSNDLDIKVHVYIWNKGRKHFYMDDFGVKAIEGNPYIYGLTQKF